MYTHFCEHPPLLIRHRSPVEKGSFILQKKVFETPYQIQAASFSYKYWWLPFRTTITTIRSKISQPIWYNFYIKMSNLEPKTCVFRSFQRFVFSLGFVYKCKHHNAHKTLTRTINVWSPVTITILRVVHQLGVTILLVRLAMSTLDEFVTIGRIGEQFPIRLSFANVSLSNSNNWNVQGFVISNPFSSWA